MMYNLLGTYYKWWYLFVFKLKSRTTYVTATFLWVFSQTVSVVVVAIVWSLSGRSDNKDILEYLILGNMFFALSSNDAAWHWHEEIFSGKITSRLLRPSSVFMQYLFEGLASTVFAGTAILIIILPLYFFYVEDTVFTWNALWLIPFLFVSYFIRFYSQCIVGIATFWIIETYGLIQTYEILAGILSGNMIPLHLLGYVGSVLMISPFAFTFYHPLAAFFGKYSFEQSATALLIGIAWCFVLHFTAWWFFRLGLRKNESVGL